MRVHYISETIASSFATTLSHTHLLFRTLYHETQLVMIPQRHKHLVLLALGVTHPRDPHPGIPRRTGRLVKILHAFIHKHLSMHSGLLRISLSLALSLSRARSPCMHHSSRAIQTPIPRHGRALSLSTSHSTLCVGKWRFNKVSRSVVDSDLRRMSCIQTSSSSSSSSCCCTTACWSHLHRNLASLISDPE